MNLRRWIALATVLGLAACAGSDMVDEAGEAAAGAEVDWTTARTITVRIRQNEFRPQLFVMARNRPHVLKLVNEDDVTHGFAGIEFFRAIEARRLTGGEREYVNPQVSNIAVEPGQTRELYFVPVRPGRYGFADRTPGFFIPLGDGFGVGRGTWSATLGAAVIE
jgi:hypothetical protein